MKIEIIRFEQSSEGTLGALLIDGRAFCVTLELEYRDNKTDQSCIPPGPYSCRRNMSPRYGDAFEVCDVPGRSDILFHAGNTAADSRGCILLGKFFGQLGGKRAVLDSRKTVDRFMQQLNGVEAFELDIKSMIG